jgi:hypothetical protein
MTWWDRWVWPAGGSGGIPGDIVATLIWVILAAIITVIAWPPLRRLLWKALGLHALHAKLDHIILEHPNIANEIPGLEAEFQPKRQPMPDGTPAPPVTPPTTSGPHT